MGVVGVEKESGKGRRIGGHVTRWWGLNGGNKRWEKKQGGKNTIKDKKCSRERKNILTNIKKKKKETFKKR